MYILRRSLSLFGVDLVWDGSKVLACQMGNRKVKVLEEYDAGDLVKATNIMRDLEDSYHDTCAALT